MRSEHQYGEQVDLKRKLFKGKENKKVHIRIFTGFKKIRTIVV